MSVQTIGQTTKTTTLRASPRCSGAWRIGNVIFRMTTAIECAAKACERVHLQHCLAISALQALLVQHFDVGARRAVQRQALRRVDAFRTEIKSK